MHEGKRTYVDEIGQIVDEVFVYRRVRRFQAQDILVSRLEGLQLRLLVLALPLKTKPNTRNETRVTDRRLTLRRGTT